MSARDRIEQVRTSRTAAKAGVPRVGEVRMELRRDLQFAAQRRLAEAIARLEPYEPEPLKRAKTFAPGLVNAIFAAVADVPDDESLDMLVMGLAKAGVGANVVQESDDGPALAEATRRAMRRFIETGGAGGSPGPQTDPDADTAPDHDAADVRPGARPRGGTAGAGAAEADANVAPARGGAPGADGDDGDRAGGTGP